MSHPRECFLSISRSIRRNFTIFHILTVKNPCFWLFLAKNNQKHVFLTVKMWKIVKFLRNNRNIDKKHSRGWDISILPTKMGVAYQFLSNFPSKSRFLAYFAIYRHIGGTPVYHELRGPRQTVKIVNNFKFYIKQSKPIPTGPILPKNEKFGGILGYKIES